MELSEEQIKAVRFERYILDGKGKNLRVFKTLRLDGGYDYNVHWEEPRHVHFVLKAHEVDYLLECKDPEWADRFVELRLKETVDDARNKQ